MAKKVETAPASVTLQAEPQPVEIDVSRLGVMVIDMQNAFCKKGGMFDLCGYDISGGQKVIKSTKRLTDAARLKGCKIIYTVAAYSPDFRELGAQDSSLRFKGPEPNIFKHPEWKDKFTFPGTWGVEVIDELKPEENDIVVQKSRRSGFFATNMNELLKAFNLKYLAFTGVATNVCVESTIRDASYHGYWPILISDACASTGEPLLQEATIVNVRRSFGWVTTTRDFLQALK